MTTETDLLGLVPTPILSWIKFSEGKGHTLLAIVPQKNNSIQVLQRVSPTGGQFEPCSSDHARRGTVEDDVSGHPHLGHVLHPARPVLVLQQVVAIHRHFVHVLLHQDLQLPGKDMKLASWHNCMGG